MTDEKLFAFIAAHIKSVWAIEQMHVLARTPDASWEIDALVRETRSSPIAAQEALRSLQDSGLVTRTSDGAYRFAPKSDELNRLAQGALKAYIERPRFVIQAIFASPQDGPA